ncbi:MAG: APC family permease [Streptosporangiaceae bacterium]
MSRVTDLGKRLLVGRALRSAQAHEQLLPKRIALPVFASDALSSVAYAPEEIFLILSVAGVATYSLAPFIAGAVAAILLTVVASYRHNVRAYTSGGGDYQVATTNLGGNFGLAVASALMVDYTLTVAVSISSGIAYVASAIPSLAPHVVLASLVVVAVLMLMNLRGVRESGTAFAVPAYAFMLGVFGMLIYGGLRFALGADLTAPSARFRIVPEESGLAGLAFLFLILRAFSSGSAALTGVEAISNGVPAFRRPKGPNAARTLLMLGLIAVSMFLGITGMALATDVKIAGPGRLLGTPPGYHHPPIIAQVGEAVFSNFHPGFYYLAAVTGLILLFAANTAFNGFPVLSSILAQDRYMPRQLHTRGDRLAYSNGIFLLAAFAGLLIYAFDASVTRLIQLYIIGVFVSFTVSQTGMVRHWTRLLREETDPTARRRMLRSRGINTFGACLTGIVLVVILITKFRAGAWIVCVAMPLIFLLMKAIRRHYDSVAREVTPGDEDVTLPGRNHAIVLVSQVHKPTLRALAYARATRPSTLEAVSVAVDAGEAQKLQDEWDRLGLATPLKILDSPFREITRPILDYVKGVRRRSPRDVVTVFIPEYVVGHWWEQLLHNQSALRLKGRLLFQPGVMVTSVPWQLASSRHRRLSDYAPFAPGAVRRPGQIRPKQARPKQARRKPSGPGSSGRPPRTPPGEG